MEPVADPPTALPPPPARPLPPPPPATTVFAPPTLSTPLPATLPPALRRSHLGRRSGGSPRRLTAGHLTPGWRNVLGVAWVGVVLSLAAVWKSSWTLGFSTWWLGPQADPRFPLILILPFVLPLMVVAGALRHVRYLPVLGIVAGLGTAAIAWGDVGRQNGFALVEFGLAAGGTLVSIAALAGMLRRREQDPAGTPSGSQH